MTLCGIFFSASFILTPTGAKAVKIVLPVVKTRPLDVPLPLMHAPLPCAILVSPSLPQDQQHVRDSVRVLHTAEHVGCPVRICALDDPRPSSSPQERASVPTSCT